jgi:hypothetical protein
MWLGIEIKTPGRADHSYNFVLVGASGGYLIERQIGREQQQLLDSLFGATDLFIDPRNSGTYVPHLCDHAVGVTTHTLDPTDLFGDLIALRLEVIHLNKRSSTASVQHQDLVDRF